MVMSPPPRIVDTLSTTSRFKMAPGLALAERTITSGGDAPQRQSTTSLRIESNTTYQTQAAESDPWVGERLFAPTELLIPITIPKPADAPASLVVQVWAASAAPVEPDHHLLYYLNGQQIGEDSWDGKGFHQSVLAVPAGLLEDGENTLTIEAPGDTEARAELAYVDWLELTYERMLNAENDTLAFEGEAGSYEMNGFGQDDISLWDVTKPDLPQQLDGFEITRQGRDYQVNFQDDAGSVVSYFSGAKPLIPTRIAPAPERLQIPSAGADYLVITHPDLQQALQPLIEHRQTQGLRTAVVTTDQIYDRFSDGFPTPMPLPISYVGQRKPGQPQPPVSYSSPEMPVMIRLTTPPALTKISYPPPYAPRKRWAKPPVITPWPISIVTDCRTWRLVAFLRKRLNNYLQ